MSKALLISDIETILQDITTTISISKNRAYFPDIAEDTHIRLLAKASALEEQQKILQTLLTKHKGN